MVSYLQKGASATATATTTSSNDNRRNSNGKNTLSFCGVRPSRQWVRQSRHRRGCPNSRLQTGEHPGELKYQKKEEQKQMKQEGDEQEEEKHWEEEQEQCGHEEENITVQHERSDHDSARRAEAEHITDTVAPWEQHGDREILLG